MLSRTCLLFLALLAVAHCATKLDVECEYGPFDVAEEEQHLHCLINVQTAAPIGQIFGFASLALNEPRNSHPTYAPLVENCNVEFSTPTYNHTMECEVHLPRFAPNGEYTFKVYAISADFSVFISNSSEFEVEEEKNDRNPPSLVSLTAPAKYNLAFTTSNWVNLVLEDDASGIVQVYYTIHSTPDGGVRLLKGVWAYEPEEGHHHHEEEEGGEEEEEHEHEHGEGEESAPTELQITVPLTAGEHTDDANPGVYYLSLQLWDAFWDYTYTTYELRSLGHTYNVTVIPPSNCIDGKYAPKINKPNTCYTCPFGTYSTQGATKCAACPSGSVPNAAQTACEQCPEGFYEFGAICIPCGSGKSAPFGAHSRQQCEQI